MTEGKDAIILVMAHFFAALLAILQPEAAPVTPPLDARWSVTFASVPVATPGYDATSAYIPLKDGQLVAVDLDRGTIRWTLDQSTAFTPATGEGLVFTVSEQTIEARDAATGAGKWRVEREDFAIHRQLAQASRDQLGKLRAEIQNKDGLMRHTKFSCPATRSGC